MSVLYVFLLALFISVGLLLIWGAFEYLQKEAFIHYYSEDFDEIEFSANATHSFLNSASSEGKNFFAIQFPGRLPQDGYETSLGDLTLEIPGHSFVIDGVEVHTSNDDRVDSTGRSIIFLTLGVNLPMQHNPDGLASSRALNLFVTHWNPIHGLRFETLNSTVSMSTDALNRSSVRLRTNDLTCSFGFESSVNMILNNNYLVTISDGSGEELFYAQPATNISFYSSGMTITSSEDYIFELTGSSDSWRTIRGSVKNVDIMRSSGELAFFQTASPITYTPIRQNLFFSEGESEAETRREDIQDQVYGVPEQHRQSAVQMIERFMIYGIISNYDDPLNLSLSFTEEEGATVSVYGMVEDARISGFSIVPNFESWLYSNFSVIATALITSIFAAFIGVFFTSKRNKKPPNCNQHCVNRERMRVRRSIWRANRRS